LWRVYELGTAYVLTVCGSDVGGGLVGSGVLVGAPSVPPGETVSSSPGLVSTGVSSPSDMGVFAIAVMVACLAISLRLVVGVTGGGVEADRRQADRLSVNRINKIRNTRGLFMMRSLLVWDYTTLSVNDMISAPWKLD
jgi:hypothetical protein